MKDRKICLSSLQINLKNTALIMLVTYSYTIRLIKTEKKNRNHLKTKKGKNPYKYQRYYLANIKELETFKKTMELAKSV